MPKGYPKSPYAKQRGRQKGTKPRWLTAREILGALDFDPLYEIVQELRKPNSDMPVDVRIDKLLVMCKMIYPQLQAAQLTIENQDDSSENKRVEELHAEVRAMLMDNKPRDIECSGQTLLSQPEPMSSPLPSDMGYLNPK